MRRKYSVTVSLSICILAYWIVIICATQIISQRQTATTEEFQTALTAGKGSVSLIIAAKTSQRDPALEFQRCENRIAAGLCAQSHRGCNSRGCLWVELLRKREEP